MDFSSLCVAALILVLRNLLLAPGLPSRNLPLHLWKAYPLLHILFTPHGLMRAWPGISTVTTANESDVGVGWGDCLLNPSLFPRFWKWN